MGGGEKVIVQEGGGHWKSVRRVDWERRIHHLRQNKTGGSR